PFSSRYCVCIRRAWKSKQFEQLETSRYLFCAGIHNSRSWVSDAVKLMSPVVKVITWYGKFNFFKIFSALAVIFSSSSHEFSGLVYLTISTLLNWCIRINPRVSRPAAPASERNDGVKAVT